jgi:hypothetical protein
LLGDQRSARAGRLIVATFLESATILEVNDVVASEVFYREKLGFGPGTFFGEPRDLLHSWPR